MESKDEEESEEVEGGEVDPFDWGPNLIPGQQEYLDPGDVKEMARVSGH